MQCFSKYWKHVYVLDVLQRQFHNNRKNLLLYILQTPVDVARNVKTLGAYLTGPCKSDIEKVRAYYYWICNNIGYVLDQIKLPVFNQLNLINFVEVGCLRPSMSHLNSSTQQLVIKPPADAITGYRYHTFITFLVRQ